MICSRGLLLFLRFDAPSGEFRRTGLRVEVVLFLIRLDLIRVWFKLHGSSLLFFSRYLPRARDHETGEFSGIRRE